MASKLALTSALLVALVALATATTYTTTVTTTTIDDEGANPQQCERQIQGKQFQSCQRYLSQRRASPYGGEQGDDLLEMSTDENPQQQSQQLKDCCDQLRQVNEQCRCQAIKKAVRQQQQHQGGSQQGQQMQQVYQKARNLPQTCQFRQPQQCEIRVIFV